MPVDLKKVEASLIASAAPLNASGKLTDVEAKVLADNGAYIVELFARQLHGEDVSVQAKNPIAVVATVLELKGEEVRVAYKQWLIEASTLGLQVLLAAI